MNKNLVTYIYLLLGIIFTTSVYAQKKESEFTLKEAIEYALKHNKKVLNADLNIQAAEKQKWETIATGLPQINASLEYVNAIKRPDELTSSPGTSFFFPKHKATPSVNLTQLIFDGSYLVGLQSTKVFLEITKNAKIKTDKEIEKAVTSAYSNVLLVQQSMNLFNKNIQNLETNITESKALLENGFIEEESIEQLQITLNDLNNNLDNLKGLKITSIKMLKYLMGLNQKNKLTVSDDLNKLSNELTIATNQNKKTNVFNNIDYLISKNNTESKKLLYRLEQSKLLPSIGAYVNAYYLGQSDPLTNDEFRFFEKDQSWYGFANIGFQLNIPIFSSFQKTAKIKKAKINWQIAQNELVDVENELGIKIQNTQTELNLAIKTLHNKKQNLSLAEKIENKNNIKYKEGIASSFELRQAQTQLYASQQEYLQAMVNVINKQAEFKALNK